MPFEFVARNGVIALANSTISGSLAVSQSVTAQSFTGSLSGSATTATTASYAINATGSFIQGGNSFGAAALIGTNDTQNLTLETNGTGRLFISSSGTYIGVGTTTPISTGPPLALLDVNGIIRARSGFQIVSDGLITVLTSSRSDNTQQGVLTFNGWGDYAFNKSLLVGYTPQATTGYGTGNLYVSNGIGIAKSSSNAVLDVNGNAIVTGSVTSTVGFTGSLLGTASYASQALTASFASTASSADNFTVRGTLTAQTIVAQTITSSIDFVTGSSRFGSNTSNTHQFTGSVTISGSLQVNGSNTILSNQTSSMSVATASYVLNAVSASYATQALTASNANTASYVLQAVSASYSLNAANAFVQGGNSFGAQANIGTNDNATLNFKTNNTSRVQIYSDGNIRVQSTASMRPLMDGMYIETHPESDNPAIIPYLGNDIAYNTLRGGTFTGTPGPGSTFVTPAATVEALFDGSTTYAFFNSSDLSGSYTASIAFPQNFQYGNTIGFSFGQGNWRAQNFKVEILVTGSYYTLDTVTNWQYGSYNKSFNYDNQNVQGAKITFSNFASSGFRIADIFLINYNSAYGKGIYVGRDGGAIYKSISVTGSVIASTGFTGSLFGTASYATTALTASNANTASYVLNAVSSSYALTSTTAASATIVNGSSGQLSSKDDRIIEPNSITNARAQFGFTSWNNDNASPYADYLHLRSYTDPSGGNDNLVSFRKDTIGMRIWQQSWNSASVYSNYRDAALVSGSATGYIPLYQSATVLTGSSIYQSGLNIGIGTIIPNALLAVNGNASITGSLVASADITGSNLRATGTTTTPNISWSNTISSNGGEIRIVQTQFRGGNNITHVWSQTTDSNGTKDLGIRRNTTGSLEIYDGVTADGAIANRRDLLARNITGSNALISGSLTVSGSANISGSLLLNGSVLSAVSGFQQTFSAATTWTVTHNLNTAYPVITVYDSFNRVVLPASITSTSANVVTITFNVATAGSVNILSGQLQQNMVFSNPSAVAISTVLGG
jgi:hypothetical protein